MTTSTRISMMMPPPLYLTEAFDGSKTSPALPHGVKIARPHAAEEIAGKTGRAACLCRNGAGRI
jgi:hypothetical protein